MLKMIYGTNAYKIRTNIAKLSHAKVEIRLEAANALSNLAYGYDQTSRANRKAILETQGIPPLVALLQDADAEVKKRAAWALHELTNGIDNKEYQNAIREAQGIPPLIALLQDEATRGAAFCALLNLIGGNPANQNAIREAQGIAPLVALLKDADANTREDAARALGLLAYHYLTNQNAIREAQGIAPLVVLLKDADANTRKYAAYALGNLANDNPANQDVIREAQGIPPLVTLLSDADYQIREAATAALSYLAANKITKDLIRDAQAIPLLVTRLRDGNKQTNISASAALWHLADNNPTNQVAIIDCGGLDGLSFVSKFLFDQQATKTLEVCQALQKNPEQLRKARQAASFITPAKTTPSDLTSTSSMASEIDSLRRQLAQAKLAAPNLAYTPTISSSAIDLDRHKRLGEGGFGVVYQGQWQMVTVAVKQLKATRLSPEALADFQEEAQRHGLLRHPNIVALFGVCIEPGNYSMVMEFMTGGSLHDVLHSTQELPWSLRKSIAQNIASGLYYLHENRIIHRDLKSLNVLLDKDNQAKLADFGLSTVKTETQSILTTAQQVGTVRWMAPELFKRGGKCSESSDIYALGWVLWEIASRKIPFEDERQANDAVIMDWIKDGERDGIPASTPPQYAALLTQCWQQRAEDRPANVKQVVDALGAVTITDSVSLASSGYQYFSI